MKRNKMVEAFHKTTKPLKDEPIASPVEQLVSTDYCSEYVDKLRQKAKSLAVESEVLLMSIREMPTIEEDVKLAENHFGQILVAKSHLERALGHYYKNENAYSND